MTIRMSYPDRYHLYSDMVRGRTDRVFVATDETPALDSVVDIEVGVPQLSVPITIVGAVVGRRPRSRRFEAGIYVRIADSEIEKCRQFLGLERWEERYDQCRKRRRIPARLGVRFVDVPGKTFETRDISDSGIATGCPADVTPGQHHRIVLTMEDGTELSVTAAVTWVSSASGMAGLKFLTHSADEQQRIKDAVARLEAARPLKRRHVLVVADDDPDILKLLTMTLTRFNYEVFQAARGDEALNMVRDLQPSLVLVDVLMPGIDGVDLCKLMRADATLVETPVIFHSALEDHVLKGLAEEAGASDYLAKPVPLTVVVNLVGEYLIS